MPHATLDPDELRELHPAELILECVGVKHAPPFDPDTLDDLRAANARLRAAIDDPAAAAGADTDFHRRLTERCGNPALLDALEPLREQLAPYTHVYLAGEGRVARSAAQHEAIIGALARGDHRTAEARLRAYRATAFGELADQLESGVRP